MLTQTVLHVLCIPGAALKQAVEAWRSSHTKLLPWVGVAALLPEQVQDLQASSGAAGSHIGRAFCFLPLPIHTALPVHVNGFFELSSNRRDVWAPSADMSGSGAARAQWNLRLMEDGVAPAYTQLLQLAAEHLGPTAALWR
jgi:sacsin